MYYIMSEIFHQFKSYYNFRSMAKPKAVELQNVWNEKKLTVTFSFFKLVLEFFITNDLLSYRFKQKKKNIHKSGLIFKLVEKFKTDEAVSIKCSFKSAFFPHYLSQFFSLKTIETTKFLVTVYFSKEKKMCTLLSTMQFRPKRCKNGFKWCVWITRKMN